MTKTTNPDLLMKKFKDKIKELGKYRIQVGIPKEYKRTEISDKRREARIERAETEALLKETDQALKKGKSLPSAKINRIKKGSEEYLADIAFKNNFGSFAEHIPARPFGSTMIPRYKDKINDVIKKQFKEALEDKQKIKNAFGRIGLACEGYMKKNLRNGNWKANAPLTIQLKGSSKPLIDKGQMLQGITHIIEDKTKK